MRKKPLLSLIWIAGVLVAPSPSQHEPAADALSRAVGITRVEGALVGAGPDYEVHFDSRGITFVPALGVRAPRLYPLRFEAVAIGRRDRMRAVSDAEPIEAGGVVRYERANAVESYELRSGEVEQSFTFASLPAGSGDLVVRGRIATDLPLRSAAADELRFEIDGLGGVRIGEVVGIDARGARARGSMRLDGDVVELRLPSAFVEDAALPLVLDPPISFSRPVTSGNDDEQADVSFDERHHRVVKAQLRLVYPSEGGRLSSTARHFATSSGFCQAS